MVMGTPSSQCVGLEFVRQYYTVLSKAPVHLHRFYSHNSSFTYGGIKGKTEPTVGQADIHKKILSLNFVDCHAKIRMVDAHWTLDNGVVIQVIGELSNNKMPMRRFMQTFVLAPQSPKKYFVLNDIFRYQDEVFDDDERADEGISETEEDDVPVNETVYPASSATINGSAHLPEQESPSAHIPTQPPPPVHVPSSPPQPAPQSPPPASPMVLSPHVPPRPVLPETPPTSVSHPEPPRSITPPPQAPSVPEDEEWESPGPSTEGQDSLEESPAPAPIPVESPPQPDPVSLLCQAPPPSNEPKTYANLLKNNTQNFSNNNTTTHAGPSSLHTASSIHQDQQVSSPPTLHSQPPRPEPSLNRSTGVMNHSSLGLQGSSSSTSSNFSQRGPRGFPDDDKRRVVVPDNQQIFVGNLPHTIGEDKLRNEFAKYGKIVDIRINTAKGKPGAAGPGRQVPNFGFISFEDEASVEKCLAARPIFLNGENRINVEEKKARSRGDSSSGMMGGGRPSMRGGMGGMQGRGGPSQGGRGGRGGGIGGSGGFNRDGRGGGVSGSRGSYNPRR